jgi:polyhydroxyalkanoate synthase
MTSFVVAVVVAAFLAAVLLFTILGARLNAASLRSAPVTCDEIHNILTEDSWRVRLYRHKAKKGPGEPVFFCHGFMSNQWNFSIPPGESMADMLAEEGYDCWLIDLRGARSSVPPAGATVDDPSIDDYLLRDIPAALDYIRKTTGHDKIHWVGHSMGGMLLFAYDAVFGSEKLASATTLGAPIGFHGMRFHKPVFLFFVRKYCRCLFRCGQRALVSIISALKLNSRLVPINWSNMNRKLGVNDLYSAVEVPPIPVSESMANAAARGVWLVKDRTVDVFENLSNLQTPLFAIFGSADPFVSVGSIPEFFDGVPIEDKKVLLLSKGAGFSANYNHVDLVMSPAIRQEVVTPMLEWLRAHGESAKHEAIKVKPALKQTSTNDDAPVITEELATIEPVASNSVATEDAPIKNESVPSAESVVVESPVPKARAKKAASASAKVSAPTPKKAAANEKKAPAAPRKSAVKKAAEPEKNAPAPEKKAPAKKATVKKVAEVELEKKTAAKKPAAKKKS